MNTTPPKTSHDLEDQKEYHYGLRTIMELFDIGPTVAITVLSVAFLVIVGGVIAFFRSAPPSTINFSTGPEDSYFHKTALRYAKALAKNGVKVNVHTSDGSLQNLERLADPKSKMDIAFVQGGIRDRDLKTENLVSLGGVTYQPLMVFYRGKKIELLSELTGKSVAIGSEGSGTRKFALRLLGANGIKEKDPGTTKLLNMDADDAIAALEKKEIDAAFIMTESASNDDVRKLSKSDEIHLMNFKQAAAINRRIDYLNVLEVPEGAIDLGKNIPDHDITLVGPMVELIATNDLHPALSDLLLDAAVEIHSRPNLYQKRGEFPTPVEHAIKLSEDAQRFYKSGKSLFYRNLPFWLASLVSRFVVVFLPIAVLLIPAIRFVPVFFRWRTQMKIRRRYRDLLILEEKFKNESDPSRRDVLRKHFERIDTEISKMRVRAAFANEFYSLRGHVDYVRTLMSKRFA
ncbi:TAXI family TRAP transporter solute-binding subunit [Bdellovibrio sp. HCB337]|uniref:TAXI family TRAP transporter solute-binding subunit n=1 Tax=Bdellovibrio sp. HCB337 TaxID=3394358 RepID=UPI0039A63FB2